MEIEGSKVHKSKTQFYVQFWWKKDRSFFKWCKTVNIFWWIFGLINFFKYLWSYLQKTWIADLWNMKFWIYGLVVMSWCVVHFYSLTIPNMFNLKSVRKSERQLASAVALVTAWQCTYTVNREHDVLLDKKNAENGKKVLELWL